MSKVKKTDEIKTEDDLRKVCNHCMQYFHKFNKLPEKVKFNRKLTSTDPEMKYHRRENEIKTTLHWGQRKLLLTEIEFLTMFAKKGDIIVYAGAAGGKHIPYLAKMFPEVTFDLWDPNPFSIKETEQIKIFNEYFTEDVAKKYSENGDKILFMSDIRTADTNKLDAEEIEEYVFNDMKMQQDWHETIKPKRSMLKFRLPWDSGKTKYLKGDIYFQVWAPQTSTETRLITDKIVNGKIKYHEYDNTKYESQCMYFNNVTRVSLYPHNVKGDGIDYCYDCRGEVYILEKYFLKYKKELKVKARNELIGEISKDMSQFLTKGKRTLSMKQPEHGHRGKMGNVVHKSFMEKYKKRSKKNSKNSKNSTI
jgi:hypothetical protein